MSENTIREIKLTNINSHLNVPIGGQTFDGSNTPIIYDGIGWTVRGYNLHTETGIVIFLDVLGIKGIWKSLPPIEVIKRWNKVIRAFMDILETRRPRGGHLFRVLSDTIIITIPTKLNDSAIRETFDLLLQPFIESLKLRMLLDDAAYHHDKFNWIGIALSPAISTNQHINAQYKTTDDSFTYCHSIPHKKTPYGGLVLNWPKFDNDRECYSILKQESQSGKDPEKYSNTFAFYQSVINIE